MTTTNLRTTRNVSVTIFLLVLVMVSPVGQAAASNPSNASQNQSQSHTLEIIHINGSVSYRLTSSGTINFTQTHAEDTDRIAGQTASGDVGGLPWETNSNDSKDVIRFTGDVLDLEMNDRDGKVRVKLDGKRVNPDTLRNTPTSAPPATSTKTTATPPSTDAPTASQSPTSTTSPVDSTPSTSDDGGFGSFKVSFVLAIAGVGLLLLLRKVE